MSLLPRSSTCELLIAGGRGNAFWAGAYFADRNRWMQRAREEGISKEQRRPRVTFARSSHHTYLRHRIALRVSS